MDRCPVEKLNCFTAPDVVVTGVLIHPRALEQPAKTDMALLESSASRIRKKRPRLESLLRAGHRLLALDCESPRDSQRALLTLEAFAEHCLPPVRRAGAPVQQQTVFAAPRPEK